MNLIITAMLALSAFTGYDVGHPTTAKCAFEPLVTVHHPGTNYSYKASACEVGKKTVSVDVSRLSKDHGQTARMALKRYSL